MGVRGAPSLAARPARTGRLARAFQEPLRADRGLPAELLHTAPVWQRPIADPAHAQHSEMGSGGVAFLHHDVDGPRARRAKGLDHVLIGEAGHEEAGRAGLRIRPRPLGRGLQGRGVRGCTVGLQE